jgi:hypothetical protein
LSSACVEAFAKIHISNITILFIDIGPIGR